MQFQVCSASPMVSLHPRMRCRSNSLVDENAVVQCQTSGHIAHIWKRCKCKVKGNRGWIDAYHYSMTNQGGIIWPSRKGIMYPAPQFSARRERSGCISQARLQYLCFHLFVELKTLATQNTEINAGMPS